MQTELLPEHTNQRSFYGKAIVSHNVRTGQIDLHSYGSHVAMFNNDHVTLLSKWDYSNTTVKHVREWLQQLGYPKLSKAEIAKQFG